MRSIFTLFTLMLSLGLFAQDFSYTFSTSTSGEYVVLRDFVKLSGDQYLVGFDHHGVDSMPVGGLMKIDKWGNPIWAKSITMEGTMASCTFEVAEKSNGNYYLWGLRMDTIVTPGSTITFAFLSEIDTDGDVLWTEQYELGTNVSIYSVNDMHLLDNGNLQMLMTVYTKTFVMETDPNGDIVWGKRCGVDTLGSGKNPGFEWRPRPDGGGMCTSKRNNDLSLMRFDTDGNLVWNRAYSMGSYNHTTDILEMPDGNYLMAGYVTAPGYVPFIMKVDDTDGDILWAKTVTGIALSYPSEVELHWEGDNVIMNMNRRTATVNPQYILRMDTSGTVLDAMNSQWHLQLMDYNKLEVVSETEHYNYGGFTSSMTGEIHGVLDKREDLFAETCVMMTAPGISSTDYIDIVDTTFTPVALDYSDQTSIVANMIDVDIVNRLTCEVLAEENPTQEDITIYPVPADDYITIGFPGEFDFTVTDLNGKVLKTGHGTGYADVNLSDVQTGIYLVRMSNTKDEFVRKIIVE